MFTNTYRPIVGGVSESVQRLHEQLERQGHRVLVVAPALAGQPEHEPQVFRVPAMQHFNGSDFSVPVLVPSGLHERIREFRPQIIHANHPFLLGDTAARIAQTYRLPLVFTHHTLYEHYTHYVPGNSPTMQRFAIALATGFTDMCDAVIAPSESIRDLLIERGVTTPLHVVPSGVNTEYFSSGDRQVWRNRLGLADDVHVFGHVGRLAQEKNLPFLTRAMCRFLTRTQSAHFLVVGEGEARKAMLKHAQQAGVADRVHFTGVLNGRELVDAYRAMDTFVFASHSETQGMVVAEAMAAGLPVVALNASGVREVVENNQNGFLLPKEDEETFIAALERMLDPEVHRRLSEGSSQRARLYDQQTCASRCLDVYQSVLKVHGEPREDAFDEASAWTMARSRLEAEWQLLRHRGSVIKDMFSRTPHHSSIKVELSGD
ncbi:glycosyltransferase [Phytohalomonas tamaricis]|uniref:glycosyltransferase n=1 Tax=Phytohalomonas tamaricis TaxID=2081032 RepID=UPI000D0AF195|nr:glycosyltransferase [Phytohalomonas tamaricis]